LRFYHGGQCSQNPAKTPGAGYPAKFFARHGQFQDCHRFQPRCAIQMSSNPGIIQTGRWSTKSKRRVLVKMLGQGRWKISNTTDDEGLNRSECRQSDPGCPSPCECPFADSCRSQPSLPLGTNFPIRKQFKAVVSTAHLVSLRQRGRPICVGAGLTSTKGGSRPRRCEDSSSCYKKLLWSSEILLGCLHSITEFVSEKDLLN